MPSWPFLLWNFSGWTVSAPDDARALTYAVATQRGFDGFLLSPNQA
jgi:hypothetical protein